MKKLIRPISIANALVLATTIFSSMGISAHIAAAQAQKQEVQFICGSSRNFTLKRKVPTTILWTPTGKIAIIQWVKPFDNYWTPERRCAKFSQSIGKAYQAGTLKYLTSSRINGSNVICTATEVNGSCKNVLMTLRPQDKPLLFLAELKDQLNGRTIGPVEHSSGEPQIYVQFDWNAVVEKASKVD